MERRFRYFVIFPIRIFCLLFISVLLRTSSGRNAIPYCLLNARPWRLLSYLMGSSRLMLSIAKTLLTMSSLIHFGFCLSFNRACAVDTALLIASTSPLPEPGTTLAGEIPLLRETKTIRGKLSLLRESERLFSSYSECNIESVTN